MGQEVVGIPSEYEICSITESFDLRCESVTQLNIVIHSFKVLHTFVTKLSAFQWEVVEYLVCSVTESFDLRCSYLIMIIT